MKRIKIFISSVQRCSIYLAASPIQAYQRKKIRHAREIEEMNKKHALAMAALKSKYSAKEDNDDSDETSHGNSRTIKKKSYQKRIETK